MIDADTCGLLADAVRLTHPGPVAAERVIYLPTRLTAYDVELPAGIPLLEALQQLLDQTGCVSANGQLVGGELREFSYYIPDVGPVGGPVANFSRPYVGKRPDAWSAAASRSGVVMVGCSATVTPCSWTQTGPSAPATSSLKRLFWRRCPRPGLGWCRRPGRGTA